MNPDWYELKDELTSHGQKGQCNSNNVNIYRK